MMAVRSFFLLASLVAGCGPEQDSSSEDDAGPGKSSLAGNGGSDGTNTDDYEALSDIDGAPFEPDAVKAFYYPEDGDPVWLLTAKEGETWLYIENYPSFGGATGAETRTLGSTEVNYATCGVCVLLKTGCQPHGDHEHCSATYMPEPGSWLTIDELGSGVGAEWSGTLSPIRFVEVSIASNTYETTPIEGGDQIELDAWSFNTVLKAD